jgi:lipid II:glycine glycyltransferase (peptidoglycan interpeptide bridge formation enzyme)
MNTVHDVMQHLLDTQQDVADLRVTRIDLEQQLADVNAQIDQKVQLLNELQEDLNKAISSANLRAIDGS